MLFRDNLIIRLFLVYRVKELRVLNKANRSSFIPSPDIQLSPIYLQMRKEYKHTFRVFSRKQEFQATYHCEKNKSIKLQIKHRHCLDYVSSSKSLADFQNQE